MSDTEIIKTPPMGQWLEMENGIGRCRATLDSITVTRAPEGVVLRIVQSGAEVAEFRLDAEQAGHLIWVIGALLQSPPHP